MPKTSQSRLFFALIAAVLVSITGRNLYRRHLAAMLVHAVEAKNVAQVRALLDRGVDANTREPGEDSQYVGAPLLSLVIDRSTTGSPTGSIQMSPQQEIACLLIQHGADVRDNHNGYSSYLQNACDSGSLLVVRCLLEHGANANYADVNATTVLQNAVNYGLYAGNMNDGRYSPSADQKARRLKISRDMVDALRQHGARLTALQAVELKDAGLLRETLEAGANVNAQERYSRTALGAAAEQGDLPLMEILLAHGAKVNLEDANGNSPLSIAAGYRQEGSSIEAVKLLLRHGANTNAVGKNSNPPLVTAITNKHADVARLLLSRGADPNLERIINDYTGNSLAAAAVYLPALVPDLLAHHADINSGDGAPLKAAIRAHHPDLVRYLLARGAKIYPDITRSTLRTPATSSDNRPRLTMITPHSTLQTAVSTLQTAVMYAPECFEMLMQAGATLENDKADIMLAAASTGHAALFDRLIALGANVNVADAQGNTPLTQTLLYAPQGVKTLLEHGANPNVVAQGQMPLLTAVRAGDAALVRLLLAHGALPNLKPPHGHTPLTFARRHPNQDIIRLLEQAGAVAD